MATISSSLIQGAASATFVQFVFFYIIGIVSAIRAVTAGINHADVFTFVLAGSAYIITF